MRGFVLAAAFALLPEYLAWHVLLSAAALALGVAISLPLAVAASISSTAAALLFTMQASSAPVSWHSSSASARSR